MSMFGELVNNVDNFVNVGDKCVNFGEHVCQLSRLSQLSI